MTAAFNVDTGGILQDIGGFGMYQKVLCVVVVGTLNGLFAMSFATQLFSLVTSDHWCWNSEVAALEEQLPLAREDTKKFSIPVVSTGELRQEVVTIYMIQHCNFLSVFKNLQRVLFFMHYHADHVVLKKFYNSYNLSIGSQRIKRQTNIIPTSIAKTVISSNRTSGGRSLCCKGL